MEHAGEEGDIGDEDGDDDDNDHDGDLIANDFERTLMTVGDEN